MRKALLVWALSLCAAAQPLTRVAFGSCCHQNRPQQLWEEIVASQPQLFLFGGDNVYVDTKDPARFAQVYAQLGALPGYRRLKQACPIMATWDDHDYGWNDAGKDYALKEVSKAAFLDFFGGSDEHEGIYNSRTFGPEGQRVQVIVLDTRWFRDPLRPDKRPAEDKLAARTVGWYLPHEGPGPTLLGDEQWEWLRDRLEEPAEVRLVLSSVQFAPDGRGMECWGNFPHERARFMKLVEETEAGGVVILSGDVHFSELSCRNDGPYPLYDFTSSGIAQSTGTDTNQAWSRSRNDYRVDNMVEIRPNFGLVEIDWQGGAITLKAHTSRSKVSYQKVLRLEQLQVRK